MATDLYALTDAAILTQIGQKLKEARIERNVSQKVLAERSGLSAFSISQMENGRNTSLLSLVMVLRALNLLDILEGLLREKPISPVALSEMMKKTPKRQHAYTMKNHADNKGVQNDFDWEKA